MAELSSADYAFLAILKVEDREISNVELDERYGVRLVARPLQRLLAADFIHTNKERRPFRHIITRAGLKALSEPWAIDDDRVDKGERRTLREKQLWAGMVALRSMLRDPKGAGGNGPDLGGRIRAAYRKMVSAPGEWVDLTALRPLFADVSKADLDGALKRLLRDDDVRLEPEPFGHRVGDAERRAAVHVGGEDRHKLAIGQP
jgi:hypothetical protein